MSRARLRAMSVHLSFSFTVESTARSELSSARPIEVQTPLPGDPMKLAACLLAAILPFAAFAADPPAPKAAKPLKIGIIGTGDIGGALARHWAKAGHQLLISSRHPEQLQALARELGPNVKVGMPREAATFGDVVLVSVPYHATAQVGRDFATEREGQ